MKRTFAITLLTLLGHWSFGQLYLDASAPMEARIDDLIGRLTLDEKIDQMMNGTAAIPRLNVPAYDYWNEALHGVGRSGKATVFPQAIGLAATFDQELIFNVANAISDEARAKYNAARAQGNFNQYSGLTFWTPNINIFRDPRWGRGQETYGEDPYLTSIMGTAFVRGLQGDDPKYLKTAACAKHFAVHSGPEKLRHNFDAIASKKDMYETYLPAFKALVEEGVESVMCAYNRTNGEPCCSHNYLINDVLRGEWNFKGHIVSDCGALRDFYSDEGHHTATSKAEAAAQAVKAGVDVNCGSTYKGLKDALGQGLLSESDLDARLGTLLRSRFKLGMFDPEEANPYSDISYDVVDSKEHRELAYQAAVSSVVMLKNDGVLPLKNDLNRYYVVGPNAASIDAMLGNYYGVNPNIVTYLEGIVSRVADGSQVQYSPGTTLDQPNVNPIDWSSGGARSADATIMVMGLTRHIEGEEGESISSPYFGDRLDYNIPQNQIDYLRKIRKGHENPVIAVITGGCPVNLAEVNELADAILFAWYAGEEGGNAVADIIFGAQSPSGRLPITFPKSLDQLPPYEDYSMEGRTYRYMTEEPMYPFGFGLSYTSFEYSDIQLSKKSMKKGESVMLTCQVKNTGAVEAREVVQLYITDNQASVATPLYSLKGVKSVTLDPGQSQTISFEVSTKMLELVNNEGEAVLERGDFTLFVAGAAPSDRSLQLGAPRFVSAQLTLK